MVGAVQVFYGDELMLISNQGTLVRTRSDEVSVQGRNTQGVRIMTLDDDDSLAAVVRVPKEEAEDAESNGGQSEV